MTQPTPRPIPLTVDMVRAYYDGSEGWTWQPALFDRDDVGVLLAEIDRLTAALAPDKAPGDTPLVLLLDDHDLCAVREATRRRKAIGYVPDGGGNEDGRLVAEVCRGWIEGMDLDGAFPDRKGALP